MFNEQFRHHLYKILLAGSFGWLASLLQQIVISGRFGSWQTFLGEWLFASIYFYVLWFYILFLLKKMPPILKRKSLRLSNVFWGLMAAIIGGVIWNFSLAIGMELIEKGEWHFTFKPGEQLRFIVLYYILLIGLTYIVMCGYKILKQFTLMRNTSMRNEKAAMEAQLQMLRSQLNPHFLFNSLNIIASTIRSNPDVAYDFTKNMALFYRKVLESENVGWVLLKEELRTINYYLKMLSIRFEEKLLIKIKVDAAQQERYLIPEFILQPVVENIIKHNECSRTKPLHIQIAVTGNGVLEVKNNIQLKNSQQDSLGIGWFNIESRYKYLGAESPQKFEEEGWFYVRVPLANAYNSKDQEI